MKISKKIMLGFGPALLSAAFFCQVSAAPQDALDSSNPNPSVTKRAAGMELSHSDRSFLKKAAEAGMKEVDISKSVVGRSTDAQINSLAQMVINDHTTANNELMSLAMKKGVTLPGPDADVTEKWAKKTTGLDKDYLSEMEDDHEDAVKLFSKATKSEDPDIAAFAQKTLPTLVHHLDMVKSARIAMK